PVFAMATLAGFEIVGSLLAAALVAVVGAAGQLGIAIAIGWVIETALLFVFVPGLSLLFAGLGILLYLRTTPPEQIALAMAIPVLTPLGLAPAMILTAAAVFGLTGVLTVAASATMTMLFAVAMGVQSLGPYAQTGMSLRQESLFNPVRAAETKAALATFVQNSNDRWGPIGTQLDPAVLWSQMTGLVSRLAGAAILYRFAVTRSALDDAPGRPGNGVLFLAAITGAILALAAGIVISATEQPEPEAEGSIPMSARRIPVR